MKKLWHIFLGIVNMLLAVAMLLSSFGGTVSPETSVIPALAAMMLPLILPLMLVALVTSVFISWRAAVFNLVVLLCCSGAILNICPLNFNSGKLIAASDPSTRFSLMTYNLMGLSNYKNNSADTIYPCTETVEYLINSGCDMIAYQEAYNLHDGHYPEVRPEMMARLRETYPYLARGRNAYVGLLSKYPVKEIPINLADTHSFFVGCYEVDINDTKVTVVNVHLQSIGLNKDDKTLYRDLTKGEMMNVDTVRSTLLHKLKLAFKARARQGIKLRHYINELKGPVIVCGDFNDIPGCYAERAMMGHDLHDAYREAGLGPAVTYRADRFYFRIDQILYRGLTPLKTRVRNNGFSDHFPVTAIFSTNPDLNIN